MNIELSSEECQHLVLMGKNGSGKTSLLETLQKRLSAMNYYHWERTANASDRQPYNQYKSGVAVLFNDEENLDNIFAEGTLITAYFPAGRKSNIIMVPYPDLCLCINFLQVSALMFTLRTPTPTAFLMSQCR